MRLTFDPRAAVGYKSPSQVVRRLTEHWFDENMYCPACPARGLRREQDNTRVVDFVCPECGAEFQLKAKGGSFGRKLRDAAWAPMMERIRANRSPHFAFLRYSRDDWRVLGLMLVPGHFVTPNIIERCRPLAPTARRPGWVGCNILLPRIPADGRLHVIDEARQRDPKAVRADWRRFAWLAEQQAEARGWVTDVLRCIEGFRGRAFRLDEVYEFEPELSALYPRNRHVRPKIRQQLQVLRDRGVLRFLGRGRYEFV